MVPQICYKFALMWFNAFVLCIYSLRLPESELLLDAYVIRTGLIALTLTTLILVWVEFSMDSYQWTFNLQWAFINAFISMDVYYCSFIVCLIRLSIKLFRMVFINNWPAMNTLLVIKIVSGFSLCRFPVPQSGALYRDVEIGSISRC